MKVFRLHLQYIFPSLSITVLAHVVKQDTNCKILNLIYQINCITGCMKVGVLRMHVLEWHVLYCLLPQMGTHKSDISSENGSIQHCKALHNVPTARYSKFYGIALRAIDLHVHMFPG